MPEIRAGYDVLFDRIKNALALYADEQAQADPLLGFDVFVDYYRVMPQSRAGALCVLYIGNLEPDARKSGARVHFGYQIQYIIECHALGARTVGSPDIRGDVAAGARLRFLIHQVLSALFLPENIDFSFAAGIIGARPAARVEPIFPDAQQIERPIASARITLEIQMTWDPTRITGPDLEQLYVDAGRFQALYGYN